MNASQLKRRERKAAIFISYSRKDMLFADVLLKKLASLGYQVRLDLKDIAPAENWKERLSALILASDAVVFVLTDNFLASKVCRWEHAQAWRLNKRRIPLVHGLLKREVPKRLSALNYIYSDAPDRGASAPSVPSPAAVKLLCNVIEVNIDWVREHTRLTELATRWSRAHKRRDRLLRGTELSDAKSWVDGRDVHFNDIPKIPGIVLEFLTASEDHDWKETYQREISHAQARLAAGEYLSALKTILALRQRGLAAPDGWRDWILIGTQLASILQQTPLEQSSEPLGEATSLSVSTEEDWALAIGFRDGSVVVQQLRLPISLDGEKLPENQYLRYHSNGLKMGFSGIRQRILPVEGSIGGDSVLVTFESGGVRLMPLTVRSPPGAEIGQFRVSHVGVSVDGGWCVNEDQVSTLWAYENRFQTIGKATLSRNGRVGLWNRYKSELVSEITLSMRNPEDRYFSLFALKQGSEVARALIAAISLAGRVYVLDEKGAAKHFSNNDGEKLPFIDLPLKSPQNSLESFDERLLIQTASEVVLLDEYDFDLLPTLEEHEITAAILLDRETVIVGYREGVIQIHRRDRKHWRTRQFLSSNAAIVELKRCRYWTERTSWVTHGFASVTQDGAVLIWRNIDTGPFRAIHPQSNDIRSVSFADEGKKLVSVSRTGVLSLWDISDPVTVKSFRDVLEFGNPCLATGERTYIPRGDFLCVSDDHKIVSWLGPDRVWLLNSEECNPTIWDNNSAIVDRVAGRACWAPQRSAVMVFPQREQDSRVTPSPVFISLARGQIRSIPLDLPALPPTAFAARMDQPEFAIFYENGTYSRVDGQGTIIGRDRLGVVEAGDEGSLAASWCEYSANGRYIAVLVEARPKLILISLSDGMSHELDAGRNQRRDYVHGPVTFSPNGKHCYAGCADGSVIEIDLSDQSPMIRNRYEVAEHVRGKYSPVLCLDVSPEGERIAAATEREIRVWHRGCDKGRRLSRPKSIQQARFISEEHLVVVDLHGRCCVIDVMTGHDIATLSDQASPNDRIILLDNPSRVVVRLWKPSEDGYYFSSYEMLPTADALNGYLLSFNLFHGNEDNSGV